MARPELAREVKALLPEELIDELLTGARTEDEIVGPGGIWVSCVQRAERRMVVAPYF